MTMETMLFTPHGSHLYGLAHAGSDEDYYTVVPSSTSRKNRQRIRGNLDTLVVTLSSFRMQCDDGVPQALEALFSPLADPGPLSAFRNAYLPDTGKTVTRYLRVMKHFALSEDFKSRRHAFRVATNLNDLLATGRFNPMLTPAQRDFVTDAAGRDDYLEVLMQYSRAGFTYEPSAG